MSAGRVLDFVIAALLLTMLLPLLMLLALAIRLEDPNAPVIFRQRRTGRHGRDFTVLKLRTMVADAEARKEELRGRSVVGWPDFRVHDDPRVTRLGRFLRATSLDELPQLVNVLRGEMALVGPRPTSFAASTYEPWQLERLEARPGLTGPWQLHGRTTQDFTARCREDIAYLRRRNLGRDLLLIARTPLAMLRRTGTR